MTRFQYSIHFGLSWISRDANMYIWRIRQSFSASCFSTPSKTLCFEFSKHLLPHYHTAWRSFVIFIVRVVASCARPVQWERVRLSIAKHNRVLRHSMQDVLYPMEKSHECPSTWNCIFQKRFCRKISEMKAESSEKLFFCPSFSTCICTGVRIPYEEHLNMIMQSRA